MAAAPHRPPGHDRDRGSVTLWFTLTSFVMIVLVGVAVDLTGQVHAQQHARDVAAQAARAGGQELNAPQAIRGVSAQANPGMAVQAAQTYLAASDVTGSATIQGGTTLIVTTSDTYQTRFLSIIGLQQMTVTGSAQARMVRAVEGAEQ